MFYTFDCKTWGPLLIYFWWHKLRILLLTIYMSTGFIFLPFPFLFWTNILCSKIGFMRTLPTNQFDLYLTQQNNIRVWQISITYKKKVWQISINNYAKDLSKEHSTSWTNCNKKTLNLPCTYPIKKAIIPLNSDSSATSYTLGWCSCQPVSGKPQYYSSQSMFGRKK